MREARRARKAAAPRAKRFAGLVVIACVVVATTLLTAFGSAKPARVESVLTPSGRLLPASPPRPQIVATRGDLRLQLPVAQSSLTAIGYHAAADGSLQLDPVGRRGNEGFLGRLVHRVFGGSRGGLAYYELSGGNGTPDSVLDVGAAPGTGVYAPVDGTVVGITSYVVSGRVYGVRVDIEPTSAPSLVVSLTHLKADPALTVGSAVTASTTKIGTVVDLAAAEHEALARYTRDAGNHVSIGVHPAAALALP